LPPCAKGGTPGTPWGFPPAKFELSINRKTAKAVLTRKKKCITGLSATKMIAALRMLFSGLRFENVN
jgi:hypothetical protein